MAVQRPCLTPGCAGMARGGAGGPRCPLCQREWDRARNARPSRAAYRDPAYQAYPIKGLPCVDCGSTLDLTRDHVVELHEGGTNDPSNLVVRCRSCNSRKSNARRREDSLAQKVQRVTAQ